jgi:hypothetical protein
VAAECVGPLQRTELARKMRAKLECDLGPMGALHRVSDNRAMPHALMYGGGRGVFMQQGDPTTGSLSFILL